MRRTASTSASAPASDCSSGSAWGERVRYWLMKTEPDVFGIDDLARVGIEPWTGVRNPWARKYMRDDMQVGDQILFYHSSCTPPGVAGIARVVRTGVADETQFDPASKYFDPGATREKPVWWCVEVELVEKLPRLVALDELRARPGLEDMVVLRIPRLSVQPVTEAELAIVSAMAREPASPKAKAKAKARAKRKPIAKQPKKASAKKKTHKQRKRR
jgi:predicted RNA-binding protein with PUA-like domain